MPQKNAGVLALLEYLLCASMILRLGSVLFDERICQDYKLSHDSSDRYF